MAKKLLLDALVKVLGEFIDLNEENLDLNLAVWSGKIVLHNMKLKSLKILRSYNISIQAGSIQSLEITIPWTALLNSPVQVVIDGVYLQVGPLNVASLDKKETRDRIMNLKLEKLLLADKFLGFEHQFGDEHSGDDGDEHSEASAAGGQSYMQQWTARIVDNIEIEIRNVHVRYEDSTTIPGTTFAAGLTLDSFEISTCDEHWRELFVSRNHRDTKTTIRKLARLAHVGVYWCLKTEPLAQKSFKEWIAEMKSRVYTSVEAMRGVHSGTGIVSPAKFKESMTYILKPDNKLLIKLTHNEGYTDPSTPNYDISLECSKLQFCADKSQFQQVLKTVDMLNAVERLRQPYSYRPQERPKDGATSRAWWKYGCKLALKKPLYIKLVKLSKQIDGKTGWEKDLCTPVQKMIMRSIEEKLPVTNLILFRHVALRELAAEYRLASQERRRQEKGQESDGQTTGWWAWYTNRNAPSKLQISEVGDAAELSGDVSISTLMAILDKPAASAATTVNDADLSNKLLYRFRLTASSSLELFRYTHPVAKATMKLDAECSFALTSMSASCALSDTQMIDCCSISPVIANIIAVRPDTTNTTDPVPEGHPHLPTISVSYINCNNRTTVRISALPIEIVLNRSCIQQLVSMFVLPASKVNKAPAVASRSLRDAPPRPKSQRAFGSIGAALFRDTPASNSPAAREHLSSPKQPVQSRLDSNAATNNVDARTVEIIFEAHAPKIIIPEDPSADNGYLFLDAGYLVVKGTIDLSGMVWKCSLSNIHAGMPLFVKDIYSANAEEAKYLIKVFS
jgi:hypothetical protein